MRKIIATICEWFVYRTLTKYQEGKGSWRKCPSCRVFIKKAVITIKDDLLGEYKKITNEGFLTFCIGECELIFPFSIDDYDCVKFSNEAGLNHSEVDRLFRVKFERAISMAKFMYEKERLTSDIDGKSYTIPLISNLNDFKFGRKLRRGEVDLSIPPPQVEKVENERVLH